MSQRIRGFLITVALLSLLGVAVYLFLPELTPLLEPTQSPSQSQAAPPAASQSRSIHLALGNPSGAVSDPAQFTNFLIMRDQYAVGYHRDRGIPTWVSWRLVAADLGDTPRYSGQFITDTSLPEGWYRVRHSDYSGSGYDRGHMVPSADRTLTPEDNQATFILTNVLPQAPANNQGPWSQLEALARDLARVGYELYIVAGGYGSLGTLVDGRLTIPEVTWKAMLVISAGAGDAASRVDTDVQVIAVWMPNTDAVADTSWEEYQVSVRCIEERTGLNLFSAVDPAVQAVIEGGSCDAASPVAPIAGGPLPPPSFDGCNSVADPAIAPNAPIRILAIDKIAETVTLRNVGEQALNLDGWVLCSIRGAQQHPIGGQINPGQVITFPGPSGNIWSNSTSDPGALYDPEGRLISYWPD